jgi:hypothetical protein
MYATGNLMGETIRLLILSNFIFMQLSGNNANIVATGGLQGGIIEVRAGNNSAISSTPMVEGFNAFQANAVSPTLGRGGYIHIHAKNSNLYDGATIEVEGTLEDVLSFLPLEISCIIPGYCYPLRQAGQQLLRRYLFGCHCHLA